METDLLERPENEFQEPKIADLTVIANFSFSFRERNSMKIPQSADWYLGRTLLSLGLTV